MSYSYLNILNPYLIRLTVSPFIDLNSHRSLHALISQSRVFSLLCEPLLNANVKCSMSKIIIFIIKRTFVEECKPIESGVHI